MGKHPCMAATFICSQASPGFGWRQVAQLGTRAHPGWDGLVQSCPVLWYWGWEVVAGSRASWPLSARKKYQPCWVARGSLFLGVEEGISVLAGLAVALGWLVKRTHLEQEFPSLLGSLRPSCSCICTSSEQSKVVLRRQGSPKLF